MMRFPKFLNLFKKFYGSFGITAEFDLHAKFSGMYFEFGFFKNPGTYFIIKLYNSNFQLHYLMMKNHSKIPYATTRESIFSKESQKQTACSDLDCTFSTMTDFTWYEPYLLNLNLKKFIVIPAKTESAHLESYLSCQRKNQ